MGSEIEIKNVNPTDVMELHQETDEDLAHTVNDEERENAKLKQRISELEVALSLNPLFAKPLVIVQSVEESLSQFRKIDKGTHLLSGIRSCVVESIKARAYLILEAFEILENVHKIGTHIRSFK